MLTLQWSCVLFILLLSSSPVHSTEDNRYQSIVEKSIKGARAIKHVAYSLRGGFVALVGGYILYEKLTEKDIEVPLIVKDFYQKELGGKYNFKIKMRPSVSSTDFQAGFNTLYIPSYGLEEVLERQQVLNELKNEEIYIDQRELDDKIKKNNKKINLYKGIGDHEIAHLKHRDNFRTPLFYLAAFMACEKGWKYTRNILETKFKHVKYPLNSIKNTTKFAGRWCIYLGLPTICYTGIFFTSRAGIRKLIEGQADAGVRDDIEVLTAMRDFFKSRSRAPEATKIEKIGDWLFGTHPSDEKRALYFEQRIINLKK